MKIENGLTLVGHLVTFEVEEWAPGKVNQRLIIDNPYTDKYGATSTNYTTVNIHRDDSGIVRELANKNKGERVMLPVGVNLKSGISKRNNQPYAFNDYYKPKGAEIEVLPRIQSTPKAVNS